LFDGRPTYAEIDLAALKHNYQLIRSSIPSQTEILAVVKADAYGHGFMDISRELELFGVNAFGVAFLAEGIQLRKSGSDKPILLLGGIYPGQERKCIGFNLSTTVFTLEQAQALNQAASGKLFRRAQLHLKIDTGMGRSGVWVDDAVPFIEKVLEMRHLEVDGVMTHFSSADDPGSDAYTLGQIDSFENLLKELKSRGHSFRYIHAGNTAALVRFPQTHYNMVRPGLGIYGMYPSEAVRSLVYLEQVITFSTKISQIKEHPPGRCISYNRRYVTSRNSRIATLYVGYNDGYPRFQSNVGQVLINGRRVPVVGTVCMDTIMVDVTDIPEVKVGDEAVLIGRQGDEEILADEIAANGQTINYEIVCKISPRVTRIFVQS